MMHSKGRFYSPGLWHLNMVTFHPCSTLKKYIRGEIFIYFSVMKYFYRSDIIDARNGEEISLIHLVVFHAKMRLIPTVYLLMPQPNYCCIWKSGSAGLYLRSLTEFTISRVEKFPFPDYNLLVSIIPPFNYSLQSPMFVYIKYLLAFTLNSLQGHFYPLRVWKKKKKIPIHGSTDVLTVWSATWVLNLSSAYIF